jgi:hypothetical protein
MKVAACRGEPPFVMRCLVAKGGAYMRQTSVDIAVLGGGMAGYYAALEGARQGKRAALIERRGFVGHELTATGHSWILNGSTSHEVFQAVGARKKLMLRELVDAGVQVLLLSTPVGIALQGQHACGVLIGNKFGLQWLAAKQIIDTTGNAAGYAQLEKVKPHHAQEVQVSYTFVMDNLRTQYESWLPIPGSFGLIENKIHIHTSLLPNTISAEMRYMVPGPISAISRGHLEQEARLKALEAFHWLRGNMPRYAQARLMDLASELLIQDAAEVDATPGMTYFPFYWNGEISTADLLTCQREAALLLSAMNLQEPENEAPFCFMLHGSALNTFETEEAQGMASCLQKVHLHADKGQFPVHTAQAVVAGAGSAGVFAALALLEKGTETLVLNPDHNTGGNRTLGRVSGNYFGFVEGMAAKANDETSALSAAIGGTGKANDRIARILLYHKKLHHPACTIFSGHTVCGVRMEGTKVCGMWAANDDGLYEVQGHVFVDATSDGDVAVFAGAKYAVGCPLDGSVMTNGQWGDSAWRMERWTDAPYHTDFDVFHPDRYDELLRAIVTAHGRNSDLDFSPFPNLRETRRIEGEYTLTLTDVLLKKPFDDLVSMACTPYDTHGIASSVLLRMGMLEFNENPIHVRLPYRCFIPKGIDGLLVGGKAISATRDASSLFRMNADVENAGYALGLLAAQSIKLGTDVRSVPLRLVQDELKVLGNLPEWAFAAGIDINAALAELNTGDPMGLLHVILLPRDEMMPRLQAQYRSLPEGDIKEKHAMALAFWGEPEGVAAMMQALDQAKDITDASVLLSDEEFGRKYIRWDGELGAYFRINRIITLLGVAGDKCALPLILPYVQKAEAGGPVVKGEDSYHHTRLDKWCVPYFDRLLCLVFAMERLADSTAVAPLTQLLHKPYISGYVQEVNDDSESISTSAWLELGIARALARCGGKEGYLRLKAFTRDARAILREHAAQVLCELAGCCGAGAEKDDLLHFPDKPQPEMRLVIE